MWIKFLEYILCVQILPPQVKTVDRVEPIMIGQIAKMNFMPQTR